MEERREYDIAIPLTKPSLRYDLHKLSGLDVQSLEPIFEQEELDERFRIALRMEFAPIGTEVHQADIAGSLPPVQELLADITRLVIGRAGLTNRFAELYPVIRDYIGTRCFGQEIELDDKAPRSHLARLDIKEGIAKYMARKIADLTIERREIEFDKRDFRLSETKPFSWRRNLPPLEEMKTMFNFVATYNDFERSFAQFLGRADDVLRFAALGTTEQGSSGTAFRVDYLKPSGAIGFYYPDWVAVQELSDEEVNWIIETKGRVWEDTEAKDVAMENWCRRVSTKTGESWKYLRVNQREFRPDLPTLRALVVEIVGRPMRMERDRQGRKMTREEVRQARDEGRR